MKKKIIKIDQRHCLRKLLNIVTKKANNADGDLVMDNNKDEI